MLCAIKSRFAWATAHRYHQANCRHEGWVDDSPDQDSLYLNEIDRFVLGWKSFRRFKRAMEPIVNRQFKSQSADFHNAYNHRIAPALMLGSDPAMRPKAVSSNRCAGACVC